MKVVFIISQDEKKKDSFDAPSNPTAPNPIK